MLGAVKRYHTFRARLPLPQGTYGSVAPIVAAVVFTTPANGVTRMVAAPLQLSLGGGRTGVLVGVRVLVGVLGIRVTVGVALGASVCVAVALGAAVSVTVGVALTGGVVALGVGVGELRSTASTAASASTRP